ncbi:MAG: M20 family metallopeptidase [Bacteroidota bacterium]
MEKVATLLADLVAIPSMNPMGRRSGGPHYSEQAIADHIASYLRKASVDVEMYDVSPSRPNVAGFVDTGSKETLLLEAHLDTVHGEGMSVDPFKPIVKNGKLFGRGACDTKGSIAAFLHAVTSLLGSGKKLNKNIRFLFVSDEEYRFSGAEAAIRRGLRATYGIAGEPTNLSVVRAHKGVTRWRITAKGIAAHSAFPDRGKNAIYLMAEVIKRIESYAVDLVRQKPHPLLGSATISVGVIEGGQAVNVVPDSCWIEIDRRSLPGETPESVVLPLKELLKDLGEVELAAPHIAVGGMEVPETSPITQMLAAAIRQTTGKAEITSAPYATDAGAYNNAGIPTVVFGPGDIAQAHTDSEWISLDQLNQAVHIIQNLVTS